MKVGELLRALGQISQLYGAAGATAAAKDIDLLVSVLRPQAAIDLGVFLTDLRRTLAQPKQKRSKPASAGKSVSAAINLPLVTRYVADLKTAGTNQAIFDRIFDVLKSDRALRLVELNEIARQYSGGVAKYRSTAAVRAEIATTFVRNARFANKLS